MQCLLCAHSSRPFACMVFNCHGKARVGAEPARMARVQQGEGRAIVRWAEGLDRWRRPLWQEPRQGGRWLTQVPTKCALLLHLQEGLASPPTNPTSDFRIVAPKLGLCNAQPPPPPCRGPCWQAGLGGGRAMGRLLPAGALPAALCPHCGLWGRGSCFQEAKPSPGVRSKGSASLYSPPGGTAPGLRAGANLGASGLGSPGPITAESQNPSLRAPPAPPHPLPGLGTPDVSVDPWVIVTCWITGREGCPGAV